MPLAATPPTPIATTAAAVEEAGLTEANVDDEAAAVAAVVAELVLLPVAIESRRKKASIPRSASILTPLTALDDVVLGRSFTISFVWRKYAILPSLLACLSKGIFFSLDSL